MIGRVLERYHMPRRGHIARATGPPIRKARPARYEMTRPRKHHAVYSRLTYSEVLGDERNETATGFWNQAQTFFADATVPVNGAMTHNGACYSSHVFATTLDHGVKHRRTLCVRTAL